MRIAVAFDCFYPLTTGGGERQYRLFAEAWAGAGHEVDYLTRRLWEGEPPQLTGARVVGISPSSELYDASGNRRPAVALFFAAGLFWHLLRNRHRYDLVLVAALPVLNVFAARLALLGSGTRLCSDFLEVWRRDQWLEYSGPVVGRVAAILQHLAVRASPWVSCYSRMNGRRLAAEGARREPIVGPGLIGTAGDRAEEAAAHDDTTPPTVVYVGRHIPDKRVDTIPAAVAWARERRGDLRCAVLGDGPQRAAVAAEVSRLGLDDVVEMPGFVAEDELHRRIAGAAVLVNPSRREGYGLVVVEACAAGTPVVLVDAEDNASVELVEEGVNGYVAASPDPEVLGAALLRAIEGGAALRRSARAWYVAAARTRTAAAAALAIVERVTAE